MQNIFSKLIFNLLKYIFSMEGIGQINIDDIAFCEHLFGWYRQRMKIRNF